VLQSAPMRNGQTEHTQAIPLRERRLWTAVLVQAICDLTGIRFHTTDRYHRATRQHFARLWFESNNRDPGSFHWICDQLELDSPWLRRRLLEMARQSSSVSMHVVRTERPKAVNLSPAEATPVEPLEEGTTRFLREVSEGSVHGQPEMAVQLPQSVASALLW
jgi:hypothetical protein